MKSFLPIIFLLGIFRNDLRKGFRREKINNDYELSYQELINMNVSCYPYDSCTEFRTDDSPVPTSVDKCSCHSHCWEYGTCCIDSPYRDKPPIQKCVSAGFKSYYMVHRCPDNTHPVSIWRNPCEREFNGTDDILSIAPVTSLDTSRTYKNYYCFRCHETTDEYVSWNLTVTSSYDAPREAYISSVTYNQTKKTWVAIFESNVSIPVNLGFVFPNNVQAEPMACDLLPNCPEWADKRLHGKCLAYSAVLYTTYSSYKNVHCALCNNVSTEDLNCRRPSVSYDIAVDKTFRHAFDITGGEKGSKKENDRINKPESCKGHHEVLNPAIKICHKLVCNVPGYVLKNYTCTTP